MAKIEEIVEETETPPKVNNANIAELKTTSDDAIAPYLKSLDYVQSHTLADIRLALGYIAVISVAASAYYEYRVGFKEARGVSLLGVGLYLIFNVALYFWSHYIEQNIVYIGRKGDITIEISTSVKKFDPTYNVTFRVYRTSDVTQFVKIDASQSFTKWFDREGTFVNKPFDNWLGHNIVQAEVQLTSGKKKK